MSLDDMMDLEKIIRRVVKPKLEPACLPNKDKERIYRDVAIIVESGSAHHAYFNTMPLIVSRARRSNEKECFADNSWAVQAIDILNDHCNNEFDEIDSIKDTIEKVYDTCVNDTGENVEYFEKAVGTLALYKGKPGMKAISDLIKEEAGKAMLNKNPNLLGSLSDILAKPEFIECFSRSWHTDVGDIEIYRKIVRDLELTPYDDGSWSYDKKLLKILTSKEINAVINNEHVPELKSLVSTMIRSNSYSSGMLRNFVEVINDNLPWAEENESFFYEIASGVVGAIGKFGSKDKALKILEVASDKEILAGVGNYYVDEYNWVFDTAGVISNFPDLDLAKDFIELAKSYLKNGFSEEGKDMATLIHSVAENAPDVKQVRKVYDLAKYYLNVDGKDVVSNILTSLVENFTELNLFGNENTVGLVEAVSDGFMKFKDGINYDLLEETIRSLDREIDNPETFGLTLEALALYQNFPDNDKLIPVCKLVGRDPYDKPRYLKEQVEIVICGIVQNSLDGTNSVKEVAKCLILYHDHKKKNEVLSHLYDVSVTGNNVAIRAKTLQNLIKAEDVDKYFDNEFLLGMLDGMKGLEKANSDDLNNLRKSFVRRQEDHRYDIWNINRFYQEFYLNISDRELSNEMSIKEIIQLFKAYDTVKRTCFGWNQEYHDHALDSFFDVLNSKVSSGDTLKEKRNILREWCYNVPRQIQDNIPDLMFAQPTVHYTNQQMGVSIA